MEVRFQLGTTKRKNPRWKWGERAGGEPAMYSTIVAISHKNHVFQRISTPLLKAESLLRPSHKICHAHRHFESRFLERVFGHEGSKVILETCGFLAKESVGVQSHDSSIKPTLFVHIPHGPFFCMCHLFKTAPRCMHTKSKTKKAY